MKLKKIAVGFLILASLSTSTFAAEPTKTNWERALESFYQTLPYVGTLAAGAAIAYSTLALLTLPIAGAGYFIVKHNEKERSFSTNTQFALADAAGYTGHVMTVAMGYFASKQLILQTQALGAANGQLTAANRQLDEIGRTIPRLSQIASATLVQQVASLAEAFRAADRQLTDIGNAIPHLAQSASATLLERVNALAGQLVEIQDRIRAATSDAVTQAFTEAMRLMQEQFALHQITAEQLKQIRAAAAAAVEPQ